MDPFLTIVISVLAALTPDMAGHLGTYLKNYKITRQLRDIPVTDLRADLIASSAPPPVRYLRTLVELETHERARMSRFGSADHHHATDLFREFCLWCEQTNEKATTQQKFITCIKNVCVSKVMRLTAHGDGGVAKSHRAVDLSSFNE